VADFETTPATEPVSIRAQMLERLTRYYPRDSRNTNFYKFLSALGDIMTDIDFEVDYTILDNGIDEARVAALYPNFGYVAADLPPRGDLNWGWDDYRFMLKVLTEAWTVYGSTKFGLRRVVQVATGVSPYVFEHYWHAGWILGQFALGATAIVQTGNYIWNSVSLPAVSTYDFEAIWPQQQTRVWACGTDGAAGQIWRSQNAGETWYTMSPPAAVIYYDIHGISPSKTWACGDTAAAAIVVQWHHIFGWSTVLSVPGISFRGIWMRSSQEGWVVGTLGTVYHWSGGTWTLTAIPGPALSLFAVDGTPDGYVYAVGASSKVVRYDPTTLTWSDVSVPGPPQDFRSVSVVDRDTAYACGLTGAVSWTTDGGASWSSTVIPPALDLHGISASSDGQDIRVVGRTGVLYYSQDGGATWGTESYQGSLVDLNGIRMRPNDTMGFICGDNGVLLRRNGQSPGYTLSNGEFLANGELIDGAILESRYGRRNSVDVIVWNVMDYNLLWRFLTEMKPAHVKLFIMFEHPFIMDYYYYDEDFYTGAHRRHLLADVGPGRGTVINGRTYGESMSRVVVNEGELFIPQLP